MTIFSSRLEIKGVVSPFQDLYPVLFGFSRCPQGDKEKALQAVLASDAVTRSRELARWHAQVMIRFGVRISFQRAIISTANLSNSAAL